MLVRTIKFTDADGKEHEESFYFDISMEEIYELEREIHIGLSDHLQRIVRTGNESVILIRLRDLILLAVAKLDEHGGPVKTQVHIESFRRSNAFDILFEEILTNADAATTFLANVIPPGVAVRLQGTGNVTDLPNSIRKPFSDLTREELLGMPQSQFDFLVGKDEMPAISKEDVVVALKRGK